MPTGGLGRGVGGSGGPGSGSGRMGGPSGGPAAGGGGRGSSRSGGTRASGRPAPLKKATVKKTTAPAGTASPSGGRGATPRPPGARVGNAPANLPKRPTAKQAEQSQKLMKGYDSSRTPGNPGANRPRRPTAKQLEGMKAAAAARMPVKGRMARADAAVQARASAIGGRAKSTFKSVPGSSQAAGMARRTGTTSVKAYNKLPGGKKTKIAVAGGVGLVGAGMYADRNKGKPGSGSPKNGDTKKMGGRTATYRNGTWYSS